MAPVITDPIPLTKMKLPVDANLRRSARNLKAPISDHQNDLPRKSSKSKGMKTKPKRASAEKHTKGSNPKTKRRKTNGVGLSAKPTANSIRFPAAKTNEARATPFLTVRPIHQHKHLGDVGPGYKDVRFVRREFVRHTHDLVDIRARLRETETILRHAEMLYKDVCLDYREMDCLRRGIENTFMPFYKEDRVLWDGSGLFGESDRYLWEDFANEMQENRRKLKRKREDDWEDRLMQGEMEQ